MSTKCVLRLNGQTVSARHGITLAEAALAQGIIIPVDCSSGQCETCRVRVVGGGVDDAGTAFGDTVLACQASLTGDAEVTFDVLPVPRKTRGSITSMTPLARDIVEVVIRTDAALPYRPGQYVKVRFPGCPVRDYSPAARPEGADEHTLALQIRLYDRGIVSSALRGRIGVGQRVVVEGSYGNAYHRHGPGRLVLVGTNTGWAPLWAIARAAVEEEPGRPIRVVAGARDPRHLYMRRDLAWLEEAGASVTVTCSGEASDNEGVLPGRPTQHLGALAPTDTVYAAGMPAMVEGVRALAAEAGATCYADPFTVGTAGPTLFGRIRTAFETGDEARLKGARPSSHAQSAPEPRMTAGRPAQRSDALRRGVIGRWFARS